MPNLVIWWTKKYGKGAFATKHFKKGDFLIWFKGKIYSLKNQAKSFSDHCLRISDNLYMGPSGEIDDYINHSCNPNAGLRIKGRRVRLIAIKNIKIGDQITWDYSTESFENAQGFRCFCGYKYCRKKIRGFRFLPKKIQKNILLSI